MSCPATWIITPDYWKACVRSIRAGITGLEKLSDADVAAFLNLHPAIVVATTGMPASYTAQMIHEARTALI